MRKQKSAFEAFFLFFLVGCPWPNSTQIHVISNKRGKTLVSKPRLGESTGIQYKYHNWSYLISSFLFLPALCFLGGWFLWPLPLSWRCQDTLFWRRARPEFPAELWWKLFALDAVFVADLERQKYKKRKEINKLKLVFDELCTLWTGNDLGSHRGYFITCTWYRIFIVNFP